MEPAQQDIFTLDRIQLLLALLQGKEGLAAQVLGENGVTTNEVTARIEKFDGGMSLDPSIKIKFTPRAERIIALACAEAKRGKRRTVEPEDLLFGILSEEAGVGMKILIDMGIDRNQILARLRC